MPLQPGSVRSFYSSRVILHDSIHVPSTPRRNYDIGNLELLAIKLALEEWRHWLEGANHRFEVITDHRNLEYLRDTKRMNPRQAQWALFLTRFDFTVSYRPGENNCRADAPSST